MICLKVFLFVHTIPCWPIYNYMQARPVLNQINCEDYLDIIADPALNGVYDPKEMLRMAEAAAACIRHSASKRPRMGQVRDL